MKTIIYIIVILVPILQNLSAQTVSGTVYELDKNGKKLTLPGVNILWEGTQIGTASDSKGNFSIKKVHQSNKLIFSYIGYRTDTVKVEDINKKLDWTMHSSKMLKEVVISERGLGTHISRLNPLQTQEITGEELCRAACCNLSESFETNASVDVNYKDAVTGSKQIQLLGLKGTYVQLMTENTPNLKGLATSYGLGYIPGQCMSSIQISKGAGSVINGYESLTGQINVEYKKPDSREIFYINALGNSEGKAESNVNASLLLNDKWSTMIFAHVENRSLKHDDNNDGFIDMPTLKQYNFFNRWKYKTPDFVLQFGAKYIEEERTGGQIDFSGDANSDMGAYGIMINTKRSEGFMKAGYIFPQNRETSIALIANASRHEQNSLFGIKKYNATQDNLYSNLIFQSIIGNTDHKYSTGIDFKYDDYNEYIIDSSYLTTDIVPGAYFQYTWHYNSIFTLLAGIRADYHNEEGLFFTPRLHTKFDITEHTHLRASAGKGYRRANVVAENLFVLANSRDLQIVEEPEMEEAWNYGINLTQYIHLMGRELTLSAEYYRTDFINQIIIDLDTDKDKVIISNLHGRSFSNSMQVEAKYELIKRLDLTTAFRYTDVQYKIEEGMIEKPLISRYKGLLTASYATNLKKWQFDYTLQLNGPGRIPSLDGNPEEFTRDEEFPVYVIMNFQINKFFRKWSMYVGVENITGFVQKNPIIAAENPYGDYFDSSLVWGPLAGRKFYVGIRYGIERD
ncbi:MAG: TonB-dependent receptor [Marinilabiliales bacterium]|nr:MAG: TonB-dependent receptor [Marinilabiliales bacterium]